MWLINAIFIGHQVVYIRNRLIAVDRFHKSELRRVDKFVRFYLRRDGLFIVRLVEKNTSDLIAAELIAGLWDQFKRVESRLDRLYSRDTAALEMMAPSDDADGRADDIDGTPKASGKDMEDSVGMYHTP